MHDELSILWLTLGLVFPRVSLFVLWYENTPMPIFQPFAALFWFFVPRVLMIVLIATTMGFHFWFWIHTVTAILAYASYTSKN